MIEDYIAEIRDILNKLENEADSDRITYLLQIQGLTFDQVRKDMDWELFKYKME